MTDITIPDEALEAAEKAFTDEMLSGNPKPEPVRAACLAMLKHWPGMHKWDTGQVWHQASIVLPLHKENTND